MPGPPIDDPVEVGEKSLSPSGEIGESLDSGCDNAARSGPVPFADPFAAFFSGMNIVQTDNISFPALPPAPEEKNVQDLIPTRICNSPATRNILDDRQLHNIILQHFGRINGQIPLQSISQIMIGSNLDSTDKAWRKRVQYVLNNSPETFPKTTSRGTAYYSLAPQR